MKSNKKIKKVLLVTHVGGFIPQFQMENVSILHELGYEVHYASNFNNMHYESKYANENYKRLIKHQIDFERNPLKLNNIKAYYQLKKLLHSEEFSFLHCHTPIGGVVGRLAGYNAGVKVIYTAHGFHFYKGASLKNWIIYFTMEWICSWMTSVLITINKEDYNCAKKHLHASRVEYVPGVGIDIKQYKQMEASKGTLKIQKELQIKNYTKIFLSVGELNQNKNHEAIIKALAQMREKEFIYLICGQGELKEFLEGLISSYHLEEKVKLLGYRNDVKEIYQVADVFLFPSKREGLSVSLMEAMASGLPVICSKIRGNIDLIEDGEGGYLIKEGTEPKYIAEKIIKVIDNQEFAKKAGKKNQENVKQFSVEFVSQRIKQIYMYCGN